MKTTDLQIYVEISTMLKQLDQYIVNFPRDVKYSYGFELRRLGISLVRNICIANECVLQQQRRVIYLEQAYGEYEALKMAIRLTTQLKALTFKQATVLDKHLAKIGAMIYKWKQTAIQRSIEFRERYKAEEHIDFTNIEQEIIQPISEGIKPELKRI